MCKVVSLLDSGEKRGITDLTLRPGIVCAHVNFTSSVENKS